MDFLEIRKKAKQAKAAERSGTGGPAHPASPEPPPGFSKEPEVSLAREALEAPAQPATAPATAPSAALVPSAKADPLDEFFYRPEEGSAELAELGGDPEVATTVVEEAMREFLGFRLGEQDYAVELAQIREIVKLPPITEVPRTPPEVAGVMSLRGEVMPVFDLRRRLRLKSAPARPGRAARVVIVDLGEGPAGLLVDAVNGVARLRDAAIEPPPPGLGIETDYLVGIGRQKDRMYVLLNLAAVLARPHALERA